MNKYNITINGDITTIEGNFIVKNKDDDKIVAVVSHGSYNIITEELHKYSIESHKKNYKILWKTIGLFLQWVLYTIVSIAILLIIVGGFVYGASLIIDSGYSSDKVVPFIVYGAIGGLIWTIRNSIKGEG